MNSVALNLATWSDGTVTANRWLVKVIRDSASETGTYVLLLTLTPAEALIRFCLEIERIPTVRTRIAPETEWKRIFSLYMVLSFRAAAEGRWHSLHLFFNLAEIALHAQPKAAGWPLSPSWKVDWDLVTSHLQFYLGHSSLGAFRTAQQNLIVKSNICSVQQGKQEPICVRHWSFCKQSSG